MRRISVVSIVVLMSTACEQADEVEEVQVHRVTTVDTLVSSETAAIGYAIDLDVASSGVVFAADLMGNAVLAVDSVGTVTSFGRRGEGPNEFSGPFALRVEGQVLFVHDRGNGRLKRMSQAGTVESMTRTASQATRAPPYIMADGGMLVSTGGEDSALAVEFDSEAQLLRRIGSPVVPLEGPGPMLEMIQAGDIPGQLRNEGLLAGVATGDVWVALTGEGEVRRYGADGSLLWSTVVDEPEMLASRELFFRRNREEATPGGFFPLRYFMDVEVVDEEAWVLLQTSSAGPAVILVFSPEGRMDRRVEVVGGGGATTFAVDPDRGSVILFTQQDAQLLRAGSVFGGAAF